jgi:hypothetical protein
MFVDGSDASFADDVVEFINGVETLVGDRLVDKRRRSMSNQSG